jgi:hypothetical protein
MTEKPRGKAPASPSDDSDSGHLGVDDRGNVTWEWTEGDDLLADDSVGSVARLSALVDPKLQIKDDDDPLSPIKSNPKGLTKGYNPYNSGALGQPGRKKKKDLRELSKWVELRKKVAQKKDDE